MSAREFPTAELWKGLDEVMINVLDSFYIFMFGNEFSQRNIACIDTEL